MQRSSESIGKLAAALAKAQIALVNPEKSLVGTISPQVSGQEGRMFNYASLASGLEIVRKTLGQHEIATVQSTATDQGAGIINLTTTLMHSSGEWIASDWPVCATSDTATPRRMGAALTYARRYALFTLVGIAGEDDLDAPDILAPVQPQSALQRSTKAGHGQLNGRAHRSGPKFPRLRANRPEPGLGRQTATGAPSSKNLLPAQSAALRERLVAELRELKSADDAAHWARRSLPEKQQLIAADEQAVENAFEVKVATFAAGHREHGSARATNTEFAKAGTTTSGIVTQPAGIDKSLLAHPEPRRLRDRAHIRYVAQQPCLICGRRPSDAHQLRFAQPTALARRVSDEFTVPLCRGHHRELHRCGDEADWWSKVGIDPTIPARKLWLDTHPLPAQPGEPAQGASLISPVVEPHGHRIRQRAPAPNYETKPNPTAATHDIV